MSVSLSRTEISRKKVDELRQALANLGLSSNGLKSELVERLSQSQISAPSNASLIPRDVHDLITKTMHSKMKTVFGNLPFSEKQKTAMVFDKTAAIEGIVPNTVTIHYRMENHVNFRGANQITKTAPSKAELKTTFQTLFERQKNKELKILRVEMSKGHLRTVVDIQSEQPTTNDTVSLGSYIDHPSKTGAMLALTLKTASNYKQEGKPNLVFSVAFRYDTHSPYDHERMMAFLPDLMLGIQWMKTYIFGNTIALTKGDLDVRFQQLVRPASMFPERDLPNTKKPNAMEEARLKPLILKKVRAILNMKT